jgi:hypothetical protein
MRTEDDLRATMDDLAAGAPSGAEVLSRFRPTPRRPRSRVALPALVAAATIMIIAIAASVVHGRQGGRSAAVAGGAGPSVAYPCAVGAHLDVTGITVLPVAGLADTTRSEISCSGVSERALSDDHGLGVGSVYVYRKGVFDTRLLEHARAVSGAGLDGYALTLDLTDPRVAHMLDPQNPADTASVIRCGPVTITVPDRTPTAVTTLGRSNGSPRCSATAAVAWEYAPNRWALVVASSMDYASSFYGHDRTAKLLAIAAATDTAQSETITVPFQNHSLPADIRMVSVYSYTHANGRVTASTVGFGVTGRSGCPGGLVCEQVGEISLTPQSGKPKMSGTPVTVGGRTGYLLDQGGKRPDIVLSLWTGTWSVTVAEASDRPLADRTLIDIATGLRYATSVTDRSTWFDVNEAFGH